MDRALVFGTRDGGSNPSEGVQKFKDGDRSSIGRALGCGPSVWRFDPARSPFKMEKSVPTGGLIFVGFFISQLYKIALEATMPANSLRMMRLSRLQRLIPCCSAKIISCEEKPPSGPINKEISFSFFILGKKSFSS